VSATPGRRRPSSSYFSHWLLATYTNWSPATAPMVGSSASGTFRSSTSARAIRVPEESRTKRMMRAGATPFCTAMMAPALQAMPSHPNEVDRGASSRRITEPSARSSRSSPWE
jgi:hypothetical protein